MFIKIYGRELTVKILSSIINPKILLARRDVSV